MTDAELAVIKAMGRPGLDTMLRTFVETAGFEDGDDEVQLVHELLNDAYNAGYSDGSANAEAKEKVKPIDPYEAWKQRTKEGIYAAAFARLAIDCSIKHHHYSKDDVRFWCEKAGEIAERWEAEHGP